MTAYRAFLTCLSELSDIKVYDSKATMEDSCFNKDLIVPLRYISEVYVYHWSIKNGKEIQMDYTTTSAAA